MGKVLAGVCLFTAGFFLAGHWALRRWQSAPASAGSDGPITFFRPIKAGEPDVASKLRLFFGGVRAGDQVILGTSAGMDTAFVDSLRTEFPHVQTDHVVCESGHHANPKINKLAQMESAARHARWLALDSDTLCDRGVIEALRAEWGADCALTAPYFFEQARNTFARLDAAATCLGLWPGVALLRATGRTGAMFGACLGVPAEVLKALGGWAAFGDKLAEDNALGRVLISRGVTIHIARTAIPLDAGRLTVGEWIHHQRRVFATYHRCDPAGSLGLPLTHGVAFSLAAFLITGRLGMLVMHAALWALRHACSASLPGEQRLRARDTWIASVLEPFFWFAGLLPIEPRWSGWRAPRN